LGGDHGRKAIIINGTSTRRGQVDGALAAVWSANK